MKNIGLKISRLKMFISIPFGWINRMLLIRIFKNPYKIENCEFFGDKQFIDIAQKSMNRIKELDSDLYKELTNSKIIFYNMGKVNAYDYYNNYFSISCGQVSSETNAVLCAIVYIYYSMLYGRNDAYFKRFEWMKLHEFPEDMTNFYVQRAAWFNEKRSALHDDMPVF